MSRRCARPRRSKSSVRSLALALVTASLSLAALTGCQTAPPDRIAPSGPAGSALPTNCEQTPQSPHDPVRLYFPTQNVRVDVTRIGLTPQQDFNIVPLDRQPLLAGWYCYSPQPGDMGPSVMVGHVDWGGSKASFGRLAQLSKGAGIEVTNRAGAVHRYVVTSKQRVAKAAFPFDRVFADSPVSRLTLITCGGPFNHQAHSYTDSDIIYAGPDPRTE